MDSLAENSGWLQGWAYSESKVWPVNINQAMFP